MTVQINSVVQSKIYYNFFVVESNQTKFCKNADAPLH